MSGMLRLIIFAAAITKLLFSTSEAMEFEVQSQGGNCGECAWILAEGEIEEGTTAKFDEFVRTSNWVPRNVYFNSPGGNLIEALEFGQFLRENGFNTFVRERSVVINGWSDYTLEESICLSACVYAFAGGVRRYAEDDAIGVHQFYRPDYALRPEDTTLSAIDLSRMQQLISVLTEYVRAMGVSTQLVTLASTITPWEPIYLLSETELAALNLDNSRPPASATADAWRVEPYGTGAAAISIQRQDGAGRIAVLSLACSRQTPELILARIVVRDSTRDWAVINGISVGQNDLELRVDGQSHYLAKERLADGPYIIESSITFDITLTRAELMAMINADSIEISLFQGMFLYRAVGVLGGTFSMEGAAEKIALALRNCV